MNDFTSFVALKPLELVIWSGLAGVIFTLAGIALVDVVAQRSRGAIRGLSFVLVLGTACLLLSGWPQAIWPGLPERAADILTVSFAPLGCALALFYLGVWTGSVRDDPMSGVIVSGYSIAMVFSSITMAWLAAYRLVSHENLLLAAWAMSAVAIVLASFVAARSITMGDIQAVGMIASCVALSLAVSGLYATALDVSYSVGLQALTAAATIAYFIISVMLSIQRARMARRLQREAAGSIEMAGPIGLPKGVTLVQKVDEALWRSARVNRSCIVAAVSVPNLYAMSEASPIEVEPVITAVMAARIRRMVGFRNVMGLYHPRCFVLAISAVQDRKRGDLVAERLLKYLDRAISLDSRSLHSTFTPQLGIGIVQVDAADGVATVEAVDIINRAEQLAMVATTLPDRIVRTRHVEDDGSVLSHFGAQSSM